ncbi:MAG: tetratricopeptide repeat protein [Candidatus Egerieousia sp.]
MKKIFISIALVLLCVAQVNAQSKEVAKSLKDLEKAKATSLKKADKADSWMKLGEAYAACYDAPITGLRLDQSQMEVKLFTKDQVVLKSEQREVAGQQYNVDVYSDKEIYYNPATGAIAAFVITKPALEGEDALDLALQNFKKAEGMGGDAKALKLNLTTLSRRHFTEALSAYRIGDNKRASAAFEKSYIVNSEPAVGEVDTLALYYAGVTAAMAKDNQRAVDFFEKCVEIGYEENGEVCAYMADCYKFLGDTAKTKQVLEAGLAKYPTSQSVLVALINIYLETNDDPNKVIAVIHSAQANEPTNASLYYAEGGVYKNLKQYEKAIELYKKAAEIDANYMFAPWAIGETYYQMGLDVQEKASMETDDNKYMELVKMLDEYLKDAIEPFQTVFEKSDDAEMKRYSAEYLKNIFFRFRDNDETSKANYEKYVKFLEGGE